MCNVIDVHTDNNLQYVFIPVSSSALRFRVKAANDAHVALTYGNVERDPMTELRIGGWGNTKSSVRRDRRKPDKVEVATPGILNRDEYVGVWVRWYNNYIATGLEGSEVPFMAYKDPCPHPIDHVAVRTGWGASGSWKIEVSPVMFKRLTPKPVGGDLSWVAMTSKDRIPPEAVVGGYEKGEVLYVARAMINDSMRPGKYVPSLKNCVVSWQNTAQRKDRFEILCGSNYKWVEMKNDALPPHAFPGGSAIERNDATLFIGRISIENDLIPGKINVQSKACYVAYNEGQREARTFEVLVIPDKMSRQLTFEQPPATVSMRRHMPMFLRGYGGRRPMHMRGDRRQGLRWL